MGTNLCKKITVKHLKGFYIRKKLSDKDIDFCVISIAGAILRHFLGRKIATQLMLKTEFEKDMAEQRNYIGTNDCGNKNGGFRFQSKLSKLAERLFNLQEINNFHRIVNELKQKQIISRFAEIEFGEFIFKSGIPFEFVVPKNKSRYDFDLTILSDPNINCEIKTKLPDTNLKEKTILKSLKKADSQMPKNEPAIVMVKIPENWVKNPKIQTELENAINRFLLNKQFRKIIGVLVSWEISHRKTPNNRYWKTKVFNNHGSSFYAQNETILKSLRNNSEKAKWVSLRALIEKWHLP